MEIFLIILMVLIIGGFLVFGFNKSKKRNKNNPMDSKTDTRRVG